MNDVLHRVRRGWWASLPILVLLGGCRETSEPKYLVVEEWTDVQQQVAWGERDAGALASHNGRMWLMGGWTYQNDVATVFNDVWSSSDGVAWTRHQDPPWSYGMYTQAASFNGRLLLMGGLKNSRQANEQLSNEVWSTLDGDRWELLTPAAQWEPRIGATLLTFRGNLWLLGGKTRNSADPAFFRNDVWKSANGRDWTQVTSSAPWPARAFHCAVVHDDRLWVIGGGDWDSMTAYADIWSSHDGATWVRHADAPWKPRIWHACASFQERIWMMGGRTFDPIDTNDEIWTTNDGDTWEPYGDSVRPTSRHAAYTVVHGRQLWTMGGGGHGLLRADVWQYPLLLPLKPPETTFAP